jgi:hypothetical protein
MHTLSALSSRKMHSETRFSDASISRHVAPGSTRIADPALSIPRPAFVVPGRIFAFTFAPVVSDGLLGRLDRLDRAVLTV